VCVFWKSTIFMFHRSEYFVFIAPKLIGMQIWFLIKK
jgi:hypothetical protein